jgi:O-antigen/teichoic acid export membrane protein
VVGLFYSLFGNRLSLRANFAWTLVANVVYAGCQWGILTVLVKMGTPESVGRFALGSAIATPAIMFAQLQLRVVQATDVQQRYSFSEYFTVRLLSLTLALLLILGLSFWQYTDVKAWIIVAFGLAKGVESLGDIYHGLFQQRERLDYVAQSKIIKGILSLLMLSVLFYLTRSVLWGVMGLIFSWGLSWLLYDIPHGRRILRTSDSELAISPLRSRARLMEIVKLALPLGLVMMMISLNTTIPRYFVERYQGEGSLGIFTAMTYIPVVGSIVVNALAQASIPRLARYHAAKKDRAFISLLIKMAVITLGLSLSSIWLALLVGRQLLILLYTPEYASYDSVFVWVMISGGAKYLGTLLGAPVSAMQRFRVQFWVHASSIVLLGAASYLLVPEYGLRGAVWAILAGDLFLIIGYAAITLLGVYHRTSHDTILRSRNGS